MDSREASYAASGLLVVSDNDGYDELVAVMPVGVMPRNFHAVSAGQRQRQSP